MESQDKCTIYQEFIHDLKYNLFPTRVDKSSSPSTSISGRRRSSKKWIPLEDKSVTSNKTEKKFRNKTGQKEIDVNLVCHNIWKKFSNKHKKSPSRINNNVQYCDKSESSISHKNQIEALSKQPNKSKSQKMTEISEATIQGHKNSYSDNNIHYLIQGILIYLKYSLNLLKILGLLLLTFLFIYCLLALDKSTQAFISRNTQDLIYPFMRSLRIISLPVVRRFPRLTDLYEESCLMSNPFYTIEDLDCWPCEGVRHVIDLTGFSNFSSEYHHSGIPFVVKDAYKKEFEMSHLERVYLENHDLMSKAFVETNSLGISTLEEVFTHKFKKLFEEPDFHLKWEINRVTTARLWRKPFPKPYFIPLGTEVSVQHFLFLDQQSSRTYPLPITEFANVFLTQASGSRSIVLIPTEICQHYCKVVSAVLQAKDVLFYNWLFWRPMSLATDSSASHTMSITYIGSFY